MGRFQEDMETYKKNDPAARSSLEIIFNVSRLSCDSDASTSTFGYILLADVDFLLAC